MVRYEDRVNDKDESANDKEEPSDQRSTAYPFDSSTNNKRIRERSEIIGVARIDTKTSLFTRMRKENEPKVF